MRTHSAVRTSGAAGLAALLAVVIVALSGCSAGSQALPSPGPQSSGAPATSSAAPSSVSGTAVSGTAASGSAVSGTGVSGTGVSGTAAGGKPATGSSTATRTSPRTSPPPVQNTLPPATAIGNVVAKRRAVTVTGCAATPDGWAATGVATNQSSKPATYTITVFFTTSGATVQDFSSTRVTVRPGAKANWTAAKRFLASKPTLCVLRGVA